MTRRTTNCLGTSFQSLEGRCLPSAGVSATLSAQGVLTVKGTNNADEIVVRQDDGAIIVDDAMIAFKGKKYDSVDAEMVRRVVVNGLNGNDFIFLGVDGQELEVPCVVNAGNGNDWVRGGFGNDTVNGGNGNDLIYGGDGYDAIFGQAGNDFMDDCDRDTNEMCNGGAGFDWNADLLCVGGTGFADINQRGSPSCSFLSTLSGLAMRGFDFTQWIEYQGMNDNGMPQYAVAFWDGSEWYWQEIEFDGGLTQLDTAPAAEGESWAILMNRAWMAYHGDDGACFPHEAIFALTGADANYGYFWDYMMGDDELQAIVDTLNNDGIVIAGTGTPDFLSTGVLVNNHAYTVVDVVEQNGTVYIVMRNPWGVDGGSTTCGNKNDGIVWVSWEDFQQSMTYLAVIS